MKHTSRRASRKQDGACGAREKEKTENKDNETPKKKKLYHIEDLAETIQRI